MYEAFFERLVSQANPSKRLIHNILILKTQDMLGTISWNTHMLCKWKSAF